MKRKINEQVNRPTTIDLISGRDKAKCPFLQGAQFGQGVMRRVADKDSANGYYIKGDILFIKNNWTFDVVRKNELVKENLPWKCDAYTQTAGVTQDTTKLTPDQQAMATTITTDDEGWSNTKPDKYDTYPQNYKTKKVGDVIYYKQTAFTNMRPDQITKLDEVLTDKGYTRKAPDYGTPEYEYAKSKPKTLADVLTQYDINEIGITDLTTRIYRLDVTDLGPKKKEDIRKEIKSYKNAPRYTALECKTNIENLYNNSPSTTKKPRKFTPLTDEYAIEEAKNIVMACIAQQGIDGFTVARGYDAGVFGVSTDDQVRQLTRDRGMYGIKSLYDSWRTSQRTATNESLDLGLKNVIRENLITISENKKKGLIQESKIVGNRFKIIAESYNSKTKKGQREIAKKLFAETAYLHSQGFDKKVINEGFWDSLSGLFGKGTDSIFQYFKEYAAKWLLEKFKVDSDSWIGNVIIVAVGNMDLADIPKLTDCNFVTKLLSKSLAEGAIRKLQNSSVGAGPLQDILRNTMVEVLEGTDLGTKIESALGSVLCPMISKLAGKIETAGETLKSNALGANDGSKSDEGILSKIGSAVGL